MIVKLCEIGKPNANGAIYTEEAIKNALQKKDREIYCTLGIQGQPIIDIEKICGRVDNMTIEDDVVYADIHMLKTPAGEIVEKLIHAGVNLSYGMCGDGVAIDNSIKEMTIVSIGITLPDDVDKHERGYN